MTLAVITSPTRGQGAVGASTATTGSFSPPADAVLVACVIANSSASGTTTATITDNKGKTWTNRFVANFASTGEEGYAAIFTTYLTAAETGMTVTVDTLGSTSTTRRPDIKVWVVTGAHNVNFFGSATTGTTTLNAFTQNTSHTIPDALLIATACEWQKRGAPTSTDLTGEFFDQAGSPGVSGGTGYRLLPTATGTEPYTFDGAGTLACAWNYGRIMLRPALAPTTNAGADVTSHVSGTLFTRTGTEPDNGGSTVVSREWVIQSGPAGVGTVISTAALLNWTPFVEGTYVLRYSATNAIGSGSDTLSITVGPPLGVPLLPGYLSNARVGVEIAWGANLTADPATWVWTEITRDVRFSEGINTVVGRSDEASESQPARLTFQVDNTGAKYSLGGKSPNYPNVRKNVPIKVSVSPDGTNYFTLFYGFAVGFTPSWTTRGNVQTVDITAAGTLRRLAQGKEPLISPLRRGILNEPSVIGYWPLEDGRAATSVLPEKGSRELGFSGTPKFSEDNTFDSSLPIARFNGSDFLALVDGYTTTGVNQVRMLLTFPTDGYASDQILFTTHTSGSIARWEVYYSILGTGNFYLRAYNNFGALLYTSSNFNFGLNGSGRYYQLVLTQNGGNVDWLVATISPYTNLGFVSGTVAGTSSVITSVTANPNRTIIDGGVGHISVQSTSTPLSSLQLELNANASESATHSSGSGRFQRLCTENGISYTTLITSGEELNVDHNRMGPQQVTALIPLLRETEKVDQGIIYDGYGRELIFCTRRHTESRTPDLIINAATFQLSPPFGPVDDDQRTINRAEIKRYLGSNFTYQDTTGPAGTNAVGIYDTSVEINTWKDPSLGLFAGWYVSRGTQEGYRYPVLSIDVLAVPQHAAAILALRPGHLVQVTGVDLVLPGHPEGPLELLVEGISHRLDTKTWRVELKCSPYTVWRSGVLTNLAADTHPYELHFDTDSSQLSAGAALGATSISVTTNSGPLWTTTSTDYPFALDIGGNKVNVTACADPTSPQVMTVTALTKALTSGMPVKLWQPAVLGL